jgi:hypothetical protein
MHNILEIALGVGLGMIIFLVFIWILGSAVYVCCGNTKKIASVRKIKTYEGVKENPVIPENSELVVNSENNNSNESS